MPVLNNPFLYSSLMKDESKKLKAIQASKETMEAARSCINTTQFQKYKTEYTKTREQIFDICENLKSSDPLVYAFEMADYMTRLRMLGTLLKTVEREARTNE